MLFEEAFYHESYANERNLDVCYERLEFLGDVVLDLVVSEYLFKNHHELREGKLTSLRSNFVCKQALYEYSLDLGLNELLKLGECEKISSREKNSIVSDIFESFVGALYLDQGLEKVKEVLSVVVIKHIRKDTRFFIDYKSKIKERCDSLDFELIYEVIKEEGMPHEKTFTIAAIVNGKILGIGVGANKKEAEQNAAKESLENLTVD